MCVGPGREVAGGAGGDPAAERRELERLREEAQRQPVLAELLLEPRPGRARLDPRRARDVVDLEHAVQPRQVDGRPRPRGRPAHRVDAADHARAAAVGRARRAARPRTTRARARAPPRRAGSATASGACGNAPAERAHDVAVGRAVRVHARARGRPARRARAAPAGTSTRGGGELAPARAPRARPSRTRGARRARPPPRAARPRDGCSSSKPQPQCLRRRPLITLSVACPSPPASSPADPGRPARWRRAGARSRSSRRPSARAAADRAIADARGPRLARRTTGSPRGWPASSATDDGPAAGAAADALVAAAGARGRLGVARRAVRGARQRRPLARRPARRRGWRRWAGRWALGAGGAVEVGEDPTETLTRELAEEWSVEPEREPVEALVCLPNRMVMLDRPGLAAARRRGHAATPSTTRTPGGRATSTRGPRRPTARCATWRGCSTP